MFEKKEKNFSNKYKILVVDDESEITDSIAYMLKREGYEVETAYDGKEALEKINIFSPDVIVLDVMMPEFNGYDICKSIEKENNIGIIMLTAKSGLIDKVLGLELGADDYLTKPFEMIELLARIKSLCRRIKKVEYEIKESNKNQIIIYDLKLDLDERTVLIKDEEVDFKPKEFELLVFLFENPRHVFSREDILNSVWDMDYIGATRTIDIHIQRIRKKLKEYGSLIKTVPKIGYKAVYDFNEV